MSSIHGHEVLHMMMAANRSFTTEALVAAIEEHFGADARFHTCSAAGMTAAALVQFLADKGKFIPQDNGFTTHESKICRH
ncbi:YecH family metal-binding protein [Musicola keenii]|uniref:YecH family metal-binding protein n=1 Tax=Musicola keenii TaxID=2884250 RepID=UPI00177BE2BA|nr:YecH family metal-binding protein [Musicola keenii]